MTGDRPPPRTDDARFSPTTGEWLAVLRSYMLIAAIAHPIWEAAQLPLYTLWSEADRWRVLFALAHCTAGDLLIAMATLVGALLLVGPGWPRHAHSYVRVGVLTVLFGLAVTLVSEWLNVNVLRRWAYAPWMPLVPVIGVGVTPLLQWLAIPIIALRLSRRR